ncbi:Lrp/AsnC family transcriptional regulator [Sinorhizobium americanum]|uniref:AsnC family transcriptional regulator n=1 Tax=Sinorhizobium americanum TaxID=194963 RepID=A0A1L3LHV4_9HYPH|nr:Lrp/AsnC family transcriptional regulator [Sinorhizobium americanum]APG83140.1 transcriptional regulator protein, AsnC family [Sinorhizobium americanum CCGM7]APG89679.1 transcriptional regulator protein, AsnC family [Sinorhizobium americanum]OAP36011.1 AsnC family transcriptional regulator [Sinorhizobium americanum]TCN36153.1 AsnC family transcriptional regulator [Sinorhizobium americanum]
MLDELDRRILEILAANARVSLKELALEAGLSSPSAAERLRKLEERGVINGFTVSVNPARLGYPLQAVVRVRPMPGMLHIVEKLIQETPEIVECDKITGDDCFVAKMLVRDMGELDTILDRIAEKAQTNTSIVKSTPVKRRLPPL